MSILSLHKELQRAEIEKKITSSSPSKGFLIYFLDCFRLLLVSVSTSELRLVLVRETPLDILIHEFPAQLEAVLIDDCFSDVLFRFPAHKLELVVFPRRPSSAGLLLSHNTRGALELCIAY